MDNEIPVDFSNVLEGAATDQVPLGQFKSVMLKQGTRLSWNSRNSGILSMTTACDSRGFSRLEFSSSCGWAFGVHWDYISHAQKLRIPIPEGIHDIYLKNITGDGDVWVVAEAPLSPKFIQLDSELGIRKQASLGKLREESFCQFGWMGGCVLEGMVEQAKKSPDKNWEDAIKLWLSRYLDERSLSYQNARGQKVNNRFTGIEVTLPVAVIARFYPDHPSIDLAIEFWESKTHSKGMIMDGNLISAEGNYTVAYPMAIISKLLDDSNLAQKAITQLCLRREALYHDSNIYLRNELGELSFKNWTRGNCWYFLGLARTLETLGKDSAPELCEHLIEVADVLISRQRADGLWDNFLDEAGKKPDTSGSSGIGAALVTGYRMGLLDQRATEAAKRAYIGILSHLEPDGWLGCVAPNNKRGEGEQHGDQRTVEPFALGLFAQLDAVIEDF